MSNNRFKHQIVNTSLFKDLLEIKTVLFSLYENISSRNRRILDKLIDLLLEAQHLFYKAYKYCAFSDEEDIDKKKLYLVDELWVQMTIVDTEISFLINQIRCYSCDNKNISDKRIEELLRLSPKLIDSSEKWRQSIVNKMKNKTNKR